MSGKSGRPVMSVAMGLLLVLAVGTTAQADSFGFSNITYNTPSYVNVAPQLAVDLAYQATPLGTDGVKFTFTNVGDISSIITRVYFDDDRGLLGQSWLFDADDGIGGCPLVDFTINRKPGNLPAGNTVTPPFEADVSFDADSPGPRNGINNSPDERLDIVFDLDGSVGFNDVLEGVYDDQLRIGLHVQGIDPNGKSDAFVNTPPTEPIPAPAAMTLSMIGLGMIGCLRRRFAA